jgi:hypothetical protein
MHMLISFHIFMMIFRGIFVEKIELLSTFSGRFFEKLIFFNSEASFGMLNVFATHWQKLIFNQLFLQIQFTDFQKFDMSVYHSTQRTRFLSFEMK